MPQEDYPKEKIINKVQNDFDADIDGENIVPTVSMQGKSEEKVERMTR